MTTESRSFERIAEEYDATRGGVPRGEFYLGAFGRFLSPASTVLEVGVGTGAVALPMTEAGHHVLGVDLAPAMLARAYDRIGARVAVADAHEVPVATGAVDAAVTVWVLHVVGDPARTVREIARVLRPGGRWIVISSDALPCDDDMAPLLHDLERAVGRFRDAPERIREWATAAGLIMFADTATDPVPYEQSPNDVISAIETRTGSSYWELTDEQWERLVVPHFERLRALPDPDRKRARTMSSPLLVFEKPA